MRRNILAVRIAAAALALVATGAIATVKVPLATSAIVPVKPPPVTKTYQVRCTSANQSLYLLIHETNGTLNGGFLYVNNMQVATLTATNAGTGVIRAKVNGNTADVGFEIHKPPTNKVMVANYLVGNRVEVCQCSYRYQ